MSFGGRASDEAKESIYIHIHICVCVENTSLQLEQRSVVVEGRGSDRNWRSSGKRKVACVLI